jgi:hypothetical protein
MVNYKQASVTLSHQSLCQSPPIKMDLDQQAGSLQPADPQMRLVNATAIVTNP